VRDATIQAMDNDPTVFLIGVGIIDPRAVWGTLSGALEKFGADRVVEGPLSENALTGICVGAATFGMRPVLVHHRIDFVMLTMDQLVNHAAKWPAMFGRQQTVPLVVRAVVGRGWGNGPQHTQSHHAVFSHIPGLKAVVPSNPRDAKGLLIAAIEDDEPVIYIEHRWLHEDNAEVPAEYFSTPIGRAAVVRHGRDLRVVLVKPPVIYIEHRWLHEDNAEVPAEYFSTPIGRAAVVRHGRDVTVVAVGPMVSESLKAAQALEQAGLSAEVIDVRTLRPLDSETILASVGKTGRLVVADSDWSPCGIAGEVIARVAETAFDALKARPVRVTWPDTPVPSSETIEAQFYPGAREIQVAATRVCESRADKGVVSSTVKHFEGPF